jgi:hypothetical protein
MWEEVVVSGPVVVEVLVVVDVELLNVKARDARLPDAFARMSSGAARAGPGPDDPSNLPNPS